MPEEEVDTNDESIIQVPEVTKEQQFQEPEVAKEPETQEPVTEPVTLPEPELPAPPAEEPPSPPSPEPEPAPAPIPAPIPVPEPLAEPVPEPVPEPVIEAPPVVDTPSQVTDKPVLRDTPIAPVAEPTLPVAPTPPIAPVLHDPKYTKDIPQKILELTPEEINAARLLWARENIADAREQSFKNRREHMNQMNAEVEAIVKANPQTTTRDIALEMSISEKSASGYLYRLVKAGRIKSSGNSHNKRYFV
jgi:hypothetical protein